MQINKCCHSKESFSVAVSYNHHHMHNSEITGSKKGVFQCQIFYIRYD